MEPMEAISEAQWSSLSGIYITEEDFMAQLLQNIDLDLGSGSASELGASAWSCNNETSFYAPNSANCFPQTSCYSNAVTFPNVSRHDHGNYHYLNPMTPNRVPEGSFLSIHSADIEGDGYLNHDELKEEEHPIEEKVNSWRKRSRSTGNVHGLKRNVKMKKSQSVDLLSTCCSENADSSGSQQKNGGSMETPAKRRERINERLKTLQSLVPNGTKVDISTMLEEAVHYVKLLQLQIKLLSSDDHWMYAPIAYNGIDIGLDQRIKTQR